jgi:hypothetical protein
MVAPTESCSGVVGVELALWTTLSVSVDVADTPVAEEDVEVTLVNVGDGDVVGGVGGVGGGVG